MLIRLIERKQPVAADAIEYEYRDAEYEYDKTPNLLLAFLTDSPPLQMLTCTLMRQPISNRLEIELEIW